MQLKTFNQNLLIDIEFLNFFLSICTDGPVFRTRPKSIEADNGASIVLTCDVVGNPPPDILWLHEPHDKVSSNGIQHTDIVEKIIRPTQKISKQT